MIQEFEFFKFLSLFVSLFIYVLRNMFLSKAFSMSEMIIHPISR